MIKTHKTGSTTLASVMFRFGVRNHLRFLVPQSHYLGGCSHPRRARAA
jgi:hypothetical protein